MKTCPICRDEFEPRTTMQKACSLICTKEQKRQRKITNEKRLAIKSRRDWEADAQKSVNAYIRERDCDLGCISCGGSLSENNDAGHYRSRGSSNALRYHPANINGQCRKCNRFLGGNIIGYRQGLRERYGDAVVEYLDNNRDAYRWSIEECKEIIELFNGMRKALKNGI